MLASAASKNPTVSLRRCCTLAPPERECHYECSCIQTERAVGILEGPVLRKRNQFGAGNQLTKRAIEATVEGFSDIADHDCAMNAIQIIFNSWAKSG